MTPLQSALYVGTVTHHRLRPRDHRLAYRLYSCLIDLDELPRLGKELRFFSVNRFNLFSFYDVTGGMAARVPCARRSRRNCRPQASRRMTARSNC